MASVTERNPEIVEKVKQIIAEQLGVDENDISPSSSFVEDLGADSLDTVELVMALEEGFGIEIPDEDAESIRTVNDAMDYIEKHAKKKEQIRPGHRAHAFNLALVRSSNWFNQAIEGETWQPSMKK